MSILLSLYKYLHDFFDLVLPNTCLYCDCVLGKEDRYICKKCFLKFKLTNYHLFKYNELYTSISKEVNISGAFSYVYFEKNSPIQILIHNLKYKDRRNIGIYLGEIYGKILKVDFVDILDIKFDYIIPVPLHNKRQEDRNYNQSEYICHGLNKYLKSKIDTKSIIRSKNTKSLTFKNHEERKIEIQDAFEIINCEYFKDKNILLVDDIITTGSTMIEICKTILENVKCNIYICSIGRTV